MRCLKKMRLSICTNEWLEFVEEEKDCYWYHPDHLGSSSWITYSDGSAVQHLHYLPWGEDFVDQRVTNWNATYTFSAKEKDTETGYSYFGSRYYSSDLSIWLSVDPLSDKYPSMSPYVYCADNPIKLVDPNGEGWYEKDGEMLYDPNYNNREEFSKSGIKGNWVGMTETRGGVYYSLFGEKIKAKSKRGMLTKKIDDAFINYANRQEDEENALFDVEIHDNPVKKVDFSGVEDFKSGSLVTFENVHDYTNGYYMASNVRLNVSEENMMGEVQSFPRNNQIEPITIGGPFAGKMALKGFHIKIGNSVKQDVVTLTFPSKEKYTIFRNRLRQLLGI